MPSREASTYYVAGRSFGTSFAPLLRVVRDCLVLDRATFQLEITVLPVTQPQFHLEFRNSSKQTKKPFSSGFIETLTSARGISSKRISTKKPCRKETNTH